MLIAFKCSCWNCSVVREFQKKSELESFIVWALTLSFLMLVTFIITRLAHLQNQVLKVFAKEFF